MTEASKRTRLELYTSAFEAALKKAIRTFWEHHHQQPAESEIEENIHSWTASGHELYCILFEERFAGFLHMGERGGGAADWLEDLFVEKNCRGKGVASESIRQMEEKLKAEGRPSLYLEVVPRNEKALRLYHHLGFDVLNTVSLRKDFINYGKMKTETICNLEFRTTYPDPEPPEQE
ncbi:MAG: GNAT family N-acetyltransferase [Anaerolineaceae bacterium]|nr:GNAT family N-acetyltransferase [Anaerolineaceae bacterium]